MERIDCHNCGLSLKFAPRKGKKVVCGHCGAIVVPASTQIADASKWPPNKSTSNTATSGTKVDSPLSSPAPASSNNSGKQWLELEPQSEAQERLDVLLKDKEVVKLVEQILAPPLDRREMTPAEFIMHDFPLEDLDDESKNALTAFAEAIERLFMGLIDSGIVPRQPFPLRSLTEGWDDNLRAIFFAIETRIEAIRGYIRTGEDLPARRLEISYDRSLYEDSVNLFVDRCTEQLNSIRESFASRIALKAAQPGTKSAHQIDGTRRWINTHMKRPLLDFERPVAMADGFPNVVRGMISIGIAIFLAYLLSHSITVARHFDRDAEIRTGIVEHTTLTTHRRRRGRVTVTYNATVAGPYGTEVVPVDSSMQPGESLRYAYSPSLDHVVEAPSSVERGGFVWHEMRSSQFVILSSFALLLGWYAYYQLRFVFIVASGRYTVNGKPPSLNRE